MESAAGGTEDEGRAHRRRARLRWRCRRGMRELDEALGAYLAHCYDDATEGERADFEALLEWQDPELYRLVCGKDDDARYRPIVEKIARALGGGHPPLDAS